MELPFVKFITAFILPPGGCLVLMIIGSFVIRRYYVSGRILILTGFTTLLVSSLPITPYLLAKWLEDTPVLNDSELKRPGARAIVILSGGMESDAPEYGQASVNRYTLERIRYGAWLQHKTHLPVLVSGGNVYGIGAHTEADLMRQSLQEDFKTPVKWVENNSRNTWENAQNSSAILKQHGIQHVYLVTHASHMRRAMEAFKQAGIKVTPAPTIFTNKNRSYPVYLLFLPSAEALNHTRQLTHELLGFIWYKLRY